jgi:hypothetical protein
MNPASRTPEGQPNRCPVCGRHVTIEPSIPPGDAPCPYCNSLLWFAEGNVPARISGNSVEQTKTQIRALVAEIATLSKCNLGANEFCQEFLSRVVQALAAVGGAVWLLGQGRTLQLAYEINVSSRLLDSTCDESLLHKRLLDYVIVTNCEQLVPPLSVATEERMGGNPTRQLLVISPLTRDNAVAGLVEIFQRPNNAPATQRGYLLFVKQMCQFGSEFLARTPHLR